MRRINFIMPVALLLATLLGTPCLLVAQVMTLDTVLSRIEKNHPMLRASDSDMHALEAYASGAKSWMAPMVGIGPYWYPYPGQRVMEENQKGMFMATIEQQIPNPAKQQARKKYLEAKTDVARISRLERFNTLRAEARGHYYRSVIAQRKLNVLRESEVIILYMLNIAKARYAYNAATAGNIYQAESRLQEIQNMQLMTSAESEESLIRLKALMRLPETYPLMIDTATSSTGLLSNTRIDLDRRSDLKQIDQSIAVMKLNQQVQRVESKPDFKIRFEHMQPRGSGMPTQFSAMAMVSIPFAPWSSRMYKAEIKGMQYTIEAMEAEREAKVLDAQAEISALTTKLRRTDQQLDNYVQRIIPALRRNYRVVLSDYQENRASLNDVVDAWEALNMAQLDHLEKMNDYYLMIVEYEKELEQ